MWENSYLYDNVGIFHFENGFYDSQHRGTKVLLPSRMRSIRMAKQIIYLLLLLILILSLAQHCHKNANQRLTNCQLPNLHANILQIVNHQIKPFYAL
jgi:hypothetical protein